MQDLISLPDLLTVKELKTILRVGQVKAYSITNEKDFPCICIGKKKLIPKEKLKLWLENKMKGVKNYERIQKNITKSNKGIL